MPALPRLARASEGDPGPRLRERVLVPGRRWHDPSVARRTARPRMSGSQLDRYLGVCRRLVLDEIRTIVPRDARCGPILYDLMLDYPLRSAKAVRPALCIATCRALGGRLESVLRSAAVLEFYHNAFLIHDDVE